MTEVTTIPAMAPAETLSLVPGVRGVFVWKGVFEDTVETCVRVVISITDDEIVVTVVDLVEEDKY
jgi:hypothetical protein